MKLGQAREHNPGGKLSAERLAVFAGVSRATINRIETGKCTPSYITAVGIARVLNRDLSEIEELLSAVRKYEQAGKVPA